MKSMKNVGLVAAALAMSWSVAAWALDSNVVRLDTRAGLGGHIGTGVEEVGAPDGSGVRPWDTTSETDGWVGLESGGEETSVCVLNAPEVAGGRLSGETSWDATRVRVVRDDVVVTAGARLILEPGAVVKFAEGAKIRVEEGGSLVARGAVLADASDDSAGGDTNLDGDATVPGGNEWWLDESAVAALARVSLADGTDAGYPDRFYTRGELYGMLPVPARRGALFGGWFTAPNGGGSSVRPDVPVEAGGTLYALWMPLRVAIDPASANVPGLGGNGTFAVAANAAWSAATEADWVEVSPDGGSGDATVSWSAAANESGESRSATIRVALADADGFRDFTLEQAGVPTAATPVIQPGDGTTFEGNLKRVRISCATAGAVIRYTLDGSVPGERSTLYAGSFNVFDTTTVRARAFADEMLPSAVATARIERLRTLAEAIDQPLWSVSTDEERPWTVARDAAHDGICSARSGEISDAETSRMWAVVEGAGTLSFWWKVDCEDDPSSFAGWDFAAFSVDGVEMARMDGDSGWVRFEKAIAGSGAHTLEWKYCKDDFDETETEDAMWVDEVAWEPTVGDLAVPVAWMEGLGLLAAGEDASDAANADPDGDGFTNAQEYMLGTDPNDPDSTFLVNLEWSNGHWSVTWEPDLLGGNYRILGRKSMTPDDDWEDVTELPDLENSEYKFFRVKALSQ